MSKPSGFQPCSGISCHDIYRDWDHDAHLFYISGNLGTWIVLCYHDFVYFYIQTRHPLPHYDECETTTRNHYQWCRTGDSSKVIGHKETHAKMTQKYELCNIYHATHQSVDATTRSVLNRQHKEHKHILSSTLKETTRLLHHRKHRNWWTPPPRNSNNLPTIWYEFDGNEITSPVNIQILGT